MLGDVIVLPDSREALVTARVEAERGSLAALLEVVTVSETSNSSDEPLPAVHATGPET